MICGTIAYKRPEIFEIWINANRLAGLDPMAIVSCDDTEQIARNEGIIFERMPNYPLGVKANRRLEIIKELDAPGIMLLGSDDIVNKQYVDYVKKHKYHYQMLSNMDIYYYDSIRKHTFYSSGYPHRHPRYGENIAIGRYFHIKTLERFNFKLWDDELKKNLDGNSYKKTKQLKNKKTWLKGSDMVVLDIKSDFNLTPIERLNVERTNNDFLKDKFCKDVIDMLKL